MQYKAHEPLLSCTYKGPDKGLETISHTLLALKLQAPQSQAKHTLLTLKLQALQTQAEIDC